MKEPGQARKWVVISALMVAGVWGYRRWQEGPAGILKFPEFITGWGAVYFGLAMIAEAAPRFAGSFALLIMTGDILQNAKPGDKTSGLLFDLNQQLAGKTSAATTATPAPQVGVGAAITSATTGTGPTGPTITKTAGQAATSGGNSVGAAIAGAGK